MSKSIEIKIEVEREFVINGKRNEAKQFCEECSKPSQMLSIDESALITNTNSRLIFGKVEAGNLHHIETDDGILLICANSLGRLANSNSIQTGDQHGI